MSTHQATLHWQHRGPDFGRGQYSREHTWTFDGGVTVPASASPAVVPAPWSSPAGVDPEEAYVAAIASCHLLTFLYLAQRQGFVVERYDDEAVGTLAKDERGQPWVSTVVLDPTITWGGAAVPTPDEVDRLHHAAHEQCFIASSVKTAITVRPRSPGAGPRDAPSDPR